MQALQLFQLTALIAVPVLLCGCRRPDMPFRSSSPAPPPPPPWIAEPSPSPSPSPSPAFPVQEAPAAQCLCIFDVDRTLTGKQGAASSCPADTVQKGVWDSAYGGGVLSLSALATSVASTGCAPCYLGIITAGDASGPGSKERAILHQHLSAAGKLPSDQWSAPSPVVSPLVQTCPDGTKQNAVPGILAWYKNYGIAIQPQDVYFFDDRSNNVGPFHSTPYNAKQISCGSRDMGGAIGFCGATVEEIVLQKGVSTCTDQSFEV